MSSMLDQCSPAWCTAILATALVSGPALIRMMDNASRNKIPLPNECSDCGSKEVQVVLKDILEAKQGRLLIRGYCATCKPDEKGYARDCSICGTLTKMKAAVVCTGTSGHVICQECFQTYAKTAFEDLTGVLRKKIVKSPTCISQVGDLPCPLFPQECNCAALSRCSVARILTEENLYLLSKAEGSIAVEIAQKSWEQQQQAKQTAQARMKPVDLIQQAVIEVLDKGATMCCPGCGVPGKKDLACVNIDCEACGREWCYFCGRRRDRVLGQCSCSPVYLHAHLEHQPGWDGFHQENESEAEGALQEFHRRRMAYFVRCVKDASGDHWEDFRYSKARHVLTNIPTQGRSISEYDIDAATTPPLFGATKAGDLRWAAEVEPIVNQLRRELSSRPTRERPELRRWREGERANDALTEEERIARGINYIFVQGNGATVGRQNQE